ncbi:hypothetical protein PJI17_30915, partial [Mycobacterium kansasii]
MDSDDLMIHEIVDASQDSTSVVVTNREHPYSEAPSSPDLECLPLRKEELKIEPKPGTSECIETTLLSENFSPENFSEFYLPVVSDSPWDTNSESFSDAGES